VVKNYLSTVSLDKLTSSSKSMDFIRMKLDACLTSHETCIRSSASKAERYRPTRLLDVGCAGDSTVRLRDRFEDTHPATYLTLSHCWGGADIFTLNRDISSQLREGIELKVLPATFQDAIYVARALKQRFIWIDSLYMYVNSFKIRCLRNLRFSLHLLRRQQRTLPMLRRQPDYGWLKK
jgi:hypothetical protein